MLEKTEHYSKVNSGVCVFCKFLRSFRLFLSDLKESLALALLSKNNKNLIAVCLSLSAEIIANMK